jgi:proline iminopeptidase
MNLSFNIIAATCKLAAALVALSFASLAQQEKPQKPLSPSEASKIIANARKIVAPNGIERLEEVRIGGIEQWVSIRGKDRRNPVLLLIHGGPGYVSIPMSWWVSRDWEEYFTVVQWDQRGAGKTYFLNDPAAVAPTLTIERMVTDAEEMASWVRKKLGKQRVFVLAHSAGSYAGLELATRHPDWLWAYIGVGQLTNSPESERQGWAFAMDAAKRAGNTEAIRELEAIAPYFDSSRPATLKDIFTQRKWLEFYGGVMAYRKDNSAESDLAELSPDYNDEEIARIWEGKPVHRTASSRKSSRHQSECGAKAELPPDCLRRAIRL